MRTFEQTRDVLEHGRVLHARLAERFQEMEDNTDRERLKLLLDYLKGHEDRLQNKLAEYEREGSETILNTWLQYVPEHQAPDIPEEIDPNVSLDELSRIVLAYEDYLIELYRGVADRADLPQAREAFIELAEFELEEKRNIARSVLRADEL